MNKIAPYIIVFLCFFCFAKMQAQTYKFKTSGVSELLKKENGKWGEWSQLELVNIPVELDTDRHRIVVYTQFVQWFDISDYMPAKENDTDIVHSFVCKDNLGVDCTLSIIIRKMQENRKQLYINYDKKVIVYNIFNM